MSINAICQPTESSNYFLSVIINGDDEQNKQIKQMKIHKRTHTRTLKWQTTERNERKKCVIFWTCALSLSYYELNSETCMGMKMLVEQSTCQYLK